MTTAVSRNVRWPNDYRWLASALSARVRTILSLTTSNVPENGNTTSGTSRLPSLDGLRAVSIGLVILGHAYQGATGSSPNTPFWLIVGNAGLGVEIFFVVSGYIITTLLLQEKVRRGSISLGQFYLRRFFRIMPPLWTYLVVVLALTAIGTLSSVSKGAIISTLTFTSNYSRLADSPALAHTWSLSVEEQFYLLWPAILSLVLSRQGREVAAKFALLLVVLAPILRVLTHLSGHPLLASRIYYTLHTRMDALMIGCFVALVSGLAPFERMFYAIRKWIGLLAAYTLLISPLATAKFGGAYIYVVGYSLEGSSIALVMLWLVRNPQSLFGRVLNAAPVVRIGVVSYSLYLWQELMLSTDLAIAKYTIPAVVCTMLAAEVSYRVVEQPFISLGRSLGYKNNMGGRVSIG